MKHATQHILLLSLILCCAVVNSFANPATSLPYFNTYNLDEAFANSGLIETTTDEVESPNDLIGKKIVIAGTNKNDVGTILIFDSSGNKIDLPRVNSSNLAYNISQLTPGYYYIIFGEHVLQFEKL